MLPSVKTLDLFKSTTDKRKDDADEDEENSASSSDAKRQRTFPSERNQFVVHVYVPLEDNEQVQDIYEDFSDITEKVVFYCEPHISLIRGHYAVQYHQIDPLLNQLVTTIESYRQFSLCLSNIQLFNNDDKSRYFIAICEAAQNEASNDIKTKDPRQSAKKIGNSSKASRQDLIKSIHSILKQYRSEIVTLDDDKIVNFIYHTSIAWFLPEDHEIGQRLCDQVSKHYADHVILARINKVHIKIGHRSKTVDLS